MSSCSSSHHSHIFFADLRPPLLPPVPNGEFELSVAQFKPHLNYVAQMGGDIEKELDRLEQDYHLQVTTFIVNEGLVSSLDLGRGPSRRSALACQLRAHCIHIGFLTLDESCIADLLVAGEFRLLRRALFQLGVGVNFILDPDSHQSDTTAPPCPYPGLRLLQVIGDWVISNPPRDLDDVAHPRAATMLRALPWAAKMGFLTAAAFAKWLPTLSRAGFVCDHIFPLKLFNETDDVLIALIGANTGKVRLIGFSKIICLLPRINSGHLDEG